MTSEIRIPSQKKLGTPRWPKPVHLKRKELKLHSPWPAQEEIDILRHACHADFWTFFLYGFGALANPKGKRWIDADVHKPMADWYQKHVLEWEEWREDGKSEQKHLAILVHREVGKTTLIGQAGQLWLHLRDAEISSYTGGESTVHSMKVLAGIKAVLDGSDPYALWPLLYGNWATSARTWTGKDVIHAARKNTARRDPSLSTFAVETSIVGSHPDVIFYDDPISYERMISDSNWLESVNSQVTSLFPVVQSDGLVVWIGTRYDDDDHYGVAFREEGVASVEGMQSDSLVPEKGGKWHVYFLAGRDAEGRPSTPKIWPEKRLQDFQRRDPLRYAAQVMNDPSVSEFNPIVKEQIKQCVIEPNDVPWHALRYAICTDTAFWDGKSRVGKDETVFIVHGYPRNGSGDVYVIEGYGSPTWRAEDFGNRLVATVQRYKKQGRKIFAITDEVTMAGKKGSWRMSLQNMFHDVNLPMPNFIEFDRGGAKKVARMVSAANFWVDGHVKIVAGSPGSERLMEQMSKIGQYMVNPKLHDDWVDAHSDSFRPELYQPMRRANPQPPPYARGAQMFEVEGLDQEMFRDDPADQWSAEVPRPPLRGNG